MFSQGLIYLVIQPSLEERGKLATTSAKMAGDSYFTDVKWPPICSLAYGCQLRCRFTSDKKTTAHRHPAAATPTLFLFSFCLFFAIFPPASAQQ